MRWLLVSAGRGPVEVRRFVAALGPALADELARRGLVVVDTEEDAGSVRIGFEGEGPVSDLVGTHELVDPVRGRGARRRWFAGVTLHEQDAPDDVLDPRDVDVQACRAGGPGGQHVNTTSSAVRAVHRPTGLSVRVSGERSQHANRRVALRRLAERLAERRDGALAASDRAAWRSHDAVERGNPVARWRRRRGGIERVGGG